MSKEYLDKCEEMLEEINKNTNNEIYKLNVQIFEKNNELIRKNEEISRLNNIIDKLEEYLNKIIDTSAKCEKITCQYVLQYLQKLKGSDKDGIMDKNSR